MRCVKLGFVTLCCPSFVALLSCTICWASSSQRRRSSVGWSAGTIPWSGASWTDTWVIHILNKALLVRFFVFFSDSGLRRMWEARNIRGGYEISQVLFLYYASAAVNIYGTVVYLLTYLTAELLNFMKHLVEILIELFKLKHCGSISLLEVKVNRHRVRLLNTKAQP